MSPGKPNQELRRDLQGLAYRMKGWHGLMGL